ncbi:portal protein [Caulobacter segnis]
MAYDSTTSAEDQDLLRTSRTSYSVVGFDYDAELTDQREKGLEYFKGEMRDVKSLPGRSKVVSLDVADAIETLLPDLVEIFTGGEDVATFTPTGQEDEEASQQETDYVNHVIFNENPGWLTFTSAFKDALQAKTGVFKWWWEEGDEEEEAFEGKSAEEFELAQQSGEVVSAEMVEVEGQERGADFVLKRRAEGRVVVDTVAPEDITVAKDTVWLPKSTYCATRSRPRAQDLINQGIDADLVKKLPSYSIARDNAVQQARDTVDETEVAGDGDALWTMRQVEVVEHYIRLKEDEQEKIYQVLTGGEADGCVLLRKQEVNAIQLSAITPFLVTHRFYGESIADKLIEIQRVRTSLMRMTMDSGYFALNQRSVIDMTMANEYTVSDYLRNEPGVPIRAKGPTAVIPVQSSGLNFDTLAHLEYFATVAEQRTGVVRNAQGLNPDTLHDTAKGAEQLMMLAQKRMRMIARTFAETGVKDLFLGVHALLRQHATKQRMARLRNKWVPVDPASWSVRNDMTIEVGLGSSGREHDLLVMDRVTNMQAAIVQAQGGYNGPLVTAQNIYAAAIRASEKAGSKNPEAFFSDPSQQPPQRAPARPEDGRDPGQDADGAGQVATVGSVRPGQVAAGPAKGRQRV